VIEFPRELAQSIALTLLTAADVADEEGDSERAKEMRAAARPLTRALTSEPRGEMVSVDWTADGVEMFFRVVFENASESDRARLREQLAPWVERIRQRLADEGVPPPE
jgi:hypothetical protein